MFNLQVLHPVGFVSNRLFRGARETGGKGIRTPGLLIANETLYQLSYTPALPMKMALQIAAKICACPAILSGTHFRASENTSEECISKSRRVFVPIRCG
jgi:hypothetical protein